MRLFKAAARWLSLLLIPVTVSALGLGEIEVKSALNQPFRAEIALESLESTQLTELTVELASPETFRRYGLDRPAYLSSFRFSVERNAGGKPVILVTSAQPVGEPFVTVLMDVRWPSGRLLREYTALLDPPVFEPTPVPAQIVPAQSAPESRPTPAAGTVSRSAPEAQLPAGADVVEPTGLFQQSRQPAAPTQPAQETGSAAAAAPAQPDQAVVLPAAEAAAAARMAPAAPAVDSYTARSGDTLWGIAQRVRGGTGLDINQMMLALYRANPEAFMGNINVLKSGAILRIPPADAVDAPTVAEANAEVIQQNAAWKSGAESAKTAPSEEAQARLQLVPPSGDSAAAGDSGRTAAEGASASGVPAGNTGELQARINTLQQELDESKRLLSVRDAEMQALQQRIAELEKSGTPAPTTAPVTGELPADEVAEAPVEPVAEAPAEEPVAEAPVAETPSVEPEPVVEPLAEQPAETPTDDEASSGAGFPGNVLIWAGVAGVMLLLAVFVVRRRKAAGAAVAADGGLEGWTDNRKNIDLGDTRKDFSDLPSNQDSIVVEEGGFAAAEAAAAFGVAQSDTPAAAVAESFGSAAAATDKFSVDDFAVGELDTQDAAGQDEVELPLEKTISTGAPLNLDQADPVAEAEFHMAYGLYDQAADLLSRALRDDPDNRAYRLKLIDVFFVWENKEGFLEQARALQAGGAGATDADWNKVLILGKQLCPADPLFSGAASSPVAGAMDLVLSDAGETAVDFAVSGDGSDQVDINFDPSTGNGDGLDFDLNSGFGSTTDIDSSGVATIALDSSSVDFDLDASDDAKTMESPTLDVIGANSPTVAVDFSIDSAATMESPTLQGPVNEPTLESPGLSVEAGLFDSDPPTDPTSIDIDLSGLADLPLDEDDFGAADGMLGAADAAGPVFGDDNKRLAPETENIYIGSEGATMFASIEQLGKVAGDTHEVPVAKISDTLEQPQLDESVGDTAEQPGLAEPAEFSGEFDDLILSNDPKFPDDATMTEVGTKLDLARAYIDMGDPEGARSILEEVLDEGGEAQQQQARQLLNELND